MSTLAAAREPGGGDAPWPRMAVAVLALAGALVSGYLLLYHLGLIGRLYCGEGGACETVQSSKWAVLAGVPVPAIGLAGYLLLLAVALAGLQPARLDDRRISAALVALAAVAVGFTAYLSAVEAFVLHAWCRWCLGSAAVIVLVLLAAVMDLATVRRRTTAEGLP